MFVRAFLFSLRPVPVVPRLIKLLLSSLSRLETQKVSRNASGSIFRGEVKVLRFLLFLLKHVHIYVRAHSPAGVLRALRVRREGHPRHLGPPLHDGVPDDHSRNFTAYGENAANK